MKVFIEEQRFRQWWLVVIILSLNAIVFYGCYKQFILKEVFGDNQMPDLGLIGTTLLMVATAVLLFLMKLETRIDEHGIKAKFSPFRTKIIPWKDIEKVYVKKYNPILDYGGWGMKVNALTIYGNKGIHIEFKNKKTFLIGTQKTSEVELILTKYKK